MIIIQKHLVLVKAHLKWSETNQKAVLWSDKSKFGVVISNEFKSLHSWYEPTVVPIELAASTGIWKDTINAGR